MGYVCIECGASVSHLVRDYGGGLNNIRLNRCSECHAFADKYVEYEPLLIFLDLMLYKPQVYRHVLANLSSPLTFNIVWRFLVVLVLLDMTIKAYLLDRKQGIDMNAAVSFDLPSKSLWGWLLHPLLGLVWLSLLENIVSIIVMTTWIAWDPWMRNWVFPWKYDVKSGSKWWRALLLDVMGTWCVSSYGKLMALLSVIWDYHWGFLYVMGGIVLCSNILALWLLLEYKMTEASGKRKRVQLRDIVLIVFATVLARGLVQLALYGLGNPIIFFVFI